MELRDVFITEIVIGFVVTALVTLFYGIVAPWYKHVAGRCIFTLLLAITLLLTNSVLRNIFPQLPGTQIAGVVLFGFYIFAVSTVGYEIYRAQIGHYRKEKFIKAEKERHRQV